jgi:hypothetical protein
MKFLCVECDEAMALVETRGPDRGSMTVVFACPGCGRQTAMLTNTSETQVVRSLGVKIGGRTMDAEPMEGIRAGLAGRSAEAGSGDSKCPFTGMVNEAFEQRAITWSEAARSRVERIPSYARSMVVRGVEEFAREEGAAEVTEAVLDRARGRMGM